MYNSPKYQWINFPGQVGVFKNTDQVLCRYELFSDGFVRYKTYDNPHWATFWGSLSDFKDLMEELYNLSQTQAFTR